MNYIFITAIAILTFKLREIKKTEEYLKITNKELLEVYDNLALSDEKLKIQYHNLEESRKLLKKNEERYRLISMATDDGLWDLDFATNEFYVNEKGALILGIDKQEAKNYIYRSKDYIHPEDISSVEKVIAEIKSGLRNTYRLEYRSLDSQGVYKWILSKGGILRNKENKLIRISGVFIDIEYRKVHDKQIRTLAYFDKVTKLPNKSMFYETMTSILADSKDKSGLVLYMDIDNFKAINDTFGHDFGDLALREVAKRLEKLKEGPKSVFRISGDEYIVIFKDYIESSSEEVAKKVQRIMLAPFVIDENEIQISMSIGLVCYPKNANSVDEIFRKADLAMYKAKELGKN